MIVISAFKWVPPMVQGYVRDLRVRWALEEAGLAYSTRLIDRTDQSSPAYRALQPFGQVPSYEEDGLKLFESGAIVLHIGRNCETLLPTDPQAQARAVTWVFAAMNTIEVYVQQLAEIDFFATGEEWAKQRRPAIERTTRQRLHELAAALGQRDFLEGRFTAGDLMMSSVLRVCERKNLEAWEPKLAAYQSRCEARPAFQRALAAHMADFEKR